VLQEIRFIGWSDEKRIKRLKYITNNSAQDDR